MVKLDTVGYWTEVKLDIIREYAQAYSTILAARRQPSFYHIYIDAFAGAGVQVSRRSGDFIAGSPLNALNISPRFKEYHLIDRDGEKADLLRKITREYENTTVYSEDCNRILLTKVFPLVRWKDYRRALCLLDPYGLDLSWEVVRTAPDFNMYLTLCP